MSALLYAATESGVTWPDVALVAVFLLSAVAVCWLVLR